MQQLRLKWIINFLMIWMIAPFSIFANEPTLNAELNSSSIPDKRIEVVLNFWFDYAHFHQPLYDRDVWWLKNPVFDESIRHQFFNLRQDAITGKLNVWLKTPRGTLAYVILLDQFSRNLFRDDPQMYQHDNLALQAANDAILHHFDQKLSLVERVFLYMPFEHSENIQVQKQSLQLFERLVKTTPADVKPIAQKYLQYAKEHYNIVEKFNRFPHRNNILGRKTTNEEAKFLETHQGW